MRARDFAPCIVLPLVVGTAGGCANFDRPEIVKDLRVLGVQSEPAEVMLSPLLLFAPPEVQAGLPAIEVATTSYVFDPRGTEVRSSFSFCAPSDEGGGGFGGGFGGGDGSDAAASAACPFGPFTDEVEADDDDPIGRVGGLERTFSLAAAAITALVGGERGVQSLASPFPVYPRLALSVRTEVDGVKEVEDAFKRVPFTLDLRGGLLPPDLIAAITSIAGGPPCPAEGPPEDEPVEGIATCVVARGPNQNPLLLGFERLDALESIEERVLEEDEEPSLSTDARLDVDPGEELILEPVFRVGSVEPFQAFLVDLQTAARTVENRLEFFDKRWFTTAGDIGTFGGGGAGGGPPDADTETPGGLLDVPTGITWTLPTDRRAGDEDALVVVVNDGRGGVAVGQVTVRYR